MKKLKYIIFFVIIFMVFNSCDKEEFVLEGDWFLYNEIHTCSDPANDTNGLLIIKNNPCENQWICRHESYSFSNNQFTRIIYRNSLFINTIDTLTGTYFYDESDLILCTEFDTGTECKTYALGHCDNGGIDLRIMNHETDCEESLIVWPR